MFGHLLLALKAGIVKNFGINKWDVILKKCDVKEEINETSTYDGDLFDKLLKASADVCGVKPESVLRSLGDVYLSHLQSNGNYPLTQVLGRNFLEFLQNIDFVHTVALSKYPNADIPFFTVDSDTTGPTMIRLHYYSRRNNLSPFVESLLSAIGKELFKKNVVIRILQQGQDGERYHILYSLDVVDMPQLSELPPTLIAQTRKNAEQQLEKKDIADQKERIEQIRKEYGESALPVQRARHDKEKWKGALKTNVLYKKLNPTIPRTLSIGPKDFCEVFPYHIVFDRQMVLKQAGVQIQEIITEFRMEVDITKYLELVHPKHNKFSFENVQKMIYSPHIVRTLRNSLITAVSKRDSVCFRGQMIFLNENSYMLYLCSPILSNVADVEECGMRMSEIPNHDVTKYFVSFSNIGGGDLSNRYQESSSTEGGVTNRALNDPNEIRQNEDNDIISMVALNAMRGGKRYKNCSVLFCDIVQFSSIVESCSPAETLELLNDLHTEFDKLLRVHGVLKIEIVGDAYLVICGIPEEIANHAERVANFGLGIKLISKLVKCPFNYGPPFGKQALIRIGIHCGDVIGGILGKRSLKFTVMGDTVVTASRLESHGLPDEIQISAAAYRELASSHFEIVQRGVIELRGKGRQFTYLLKKNIYISDNAILGRNNENPYK